MVLCIIAFFVFAFLSIFSAKYRPLAREGFECVFRTITLRPCQTGLDDRIKAGLVSGVLAHSPFAARLLNRHFTLLSWLFVLLTLASAAYLAYGVYNFYYYGNCEGPDQTGACIINDLTGDYGRFSEPKDLLAPTSLDGMAAGNQSAKVKIVEFGCFTCAYTKKAEGTVQQLLSEFNGSIYYVFKPFPLPNHAYSSDAARAVLCANRQGKQLALREAIFSHQEACADQGTLAIKQLAGQSGMDMSAFNSCFDNNETGAELSAYIEQGKQSHLYATPTFFINGKALVGPRPMEEFRKAIQEAGG